MIKLEITISDAFRLQDFLIKFESEDFNTSKILKQLHVGISDGSVLELLNARDELNELSKKEFEISQLIIQDFNNNDIAGMMGVSKNTILFHKKNIYKKVGCSGPLSLYKALLKHED